MVEFSVLVFSFFWVMLLYSFRLLWQVEGLEPGVVWIKVQRVAWLRFRNLPLMGSSIWGFSVV